MAQPSPSPAAPWLSGVQCRSLVVLLRKTVAAEVAQTGKCSGRKMGTREPLGQRREQPALLEGEAGPALPLTLSSYWAGVVLWAG